MRLAFLDAIQAERETHPPAQLISPLPGYTPIDATTDGAAGWLRRQSGALALISALLTTALIGLLVGHWMAPARGPSTQVLKLEGALAGAGPGASGAGAAPATSSSTGRASAAKAVEAQEVNEVKEAEAPAAKPPPPVKTSSSGLQKLSKLKGKTYQRAVDKLVKGDQPIQTGG